MLLLLMSLLKVFGYTSILSNMYYIMEEFLKRYESMFSTMRHKYYLVFIFINYLSILS